MKPEKIKELNEKILDFYDKLIKDLNEKIDSLENYLKNSEVKLEDAIEKKVNDTIDSLSDVRENVIEVYNQMKTKNDENIPLFIKKDSDESLFNDTVYQDKITEKFDKSNNINNQIVELNSQKEKIKSSGKLSEFVKGMLDKRIKKLSSKVGSIEDKQSKIVDKALKAKLKEYQSKVKEDYALASKITKLENKKQENHEEYEKIKEENEILKNESLHKDKNIGIFSRQAINIVSGLSSARLLGLKAKSGMIKHFENHIINRNVHPSIIQKMKSTAFNFGKKIANGAKAFWNEMTKESEPVKAK